MAGMSRGSGLGGAADRADDQDGHEPAVRPKTNPRGSGTARRPGHVPAVAHARRERTVDPRAVRVSPGPGFESVAALIVEPAPAEPAGDGDGGGPSAGRPIVNGRPEVASLRRIGAERARLEPGGATVMLLPPHASGRAPRGVIRREVVVDGWRIEVDVESEARARLRQRASRGGGPATHGGPTEMRAIIPGRVLLIAVAVGDRVAAGQPAMIIEAMKMQNELRVATGGLVSRIAVGSGETVEVGDLLFVIEAAGADGTDGGTPVR
jgi:biotin carboxyl carrier protein